MMTSPSLGGVRLKPRTRPAHGAGWSRYALHLSAESGTEFSSVRASRQVG